MENLPNEPVQNVQHSVFNILKRKKIIFLTVILAFFLSLFYYFFLSAPRDFPVRSSVGIEPGSSLRSVSLKLKQKHFIGSRTLFEAFVIIMGGEKHVVANDYYFGTKLTVWQMAERISSGKHNMAPVIVTIPEGFNLNQIGDTFASKLANFNKNQFLLMAKEKEGYLFPDTYFFLTNANETNIIKSMSENFEKKFASFLTEVNSSGKTKKDILIMASIVEKESKGDNDREVISGILWRRISIGMPLQVDVAMETYITKGLPERPIGNPGLLAIKAAIHPQKTPYLYYLHDKDGNIHYAKTFVEHKKNIINYLK